MHEKRSLVYYKDGSWVLADIKVVDTYFTRRDAILAGRKRLREAGGGRLHYPKSRTKLQEFIVWITGGRRTHSSAG